MNNRHHLLATAAVLAGLFSFAAPASATKLEQIEVQKEIASCIAELGKRADYTDAHQVRHEIVVSKRRAVGHKLRIKTSVFSESEENPIRAYATRCIVYRDNAPLRFDIRELDTTAL